MAQVPTETSVWLQVVSLFPLHGSKGVFSYLVPANSLTVVRVAR